MNVRSLSVFLAVFFMSAPVLLADETMRWPFNERSRFVLSMATDTGSIPFQNSRETMQGNSFACQASLENEYENYIHRHPQFLAALDDNERFKRWKLHMAQNPYEPVELCLYRRVWAQLDFLMMSDEVGEDFLYCNGRFTRDPRTRDEANAKALIEELVTYASHGAERAVSYYNQFSLIESPIYHNFEISYYFKYLALRRKPSRLTADSVLFYQSIISPERRLFIDGFVRRADYEGFVATLPPCEPGETR